MSDVDNGSQAQANPEMSDAGLEGGPEVGDPEAVGEEIDEMPEGDEEVLSYKEVSEMSEVTQESYPEGYVVSHAATAAVEDLVDFEKLKQQTQKKLKIAESEMDPNERLSQVDSTRSEDADEFLRNFFIKFGMKKTLDSF